MLTIKQCKTEQDFAVAAELMAELSAWDSAETAKLGFTVESVLDFYYSDTSGLPDPNANSGELSLLGYAGSEAGGCIGYRTLEPAICELKRLYVRPTFRRTGLGQALVASLILHAKAAGYKRMRLETVSFMTGAIRMYESNGFVRRPPYYDIPECFLPITVFMEMNIEG